MVTPDSEVEVILRYPEVRQNNVFILIVLRWEHQNKCRNVRGGGQVQTAVADTAFQIVFADGKLAFVPFLHRHPTDSLLNPLVQAQLSEGILLTGVLLCGLAGVLDFVDAYRNTKGWVCLFPNRRICPIIRVLRTVNYRVKGMVDLPSSNDVLGFLVYLITDGLCIVACRGDKEIQRLHTGIAGTFGHNIKELAVRLGVQLIEHHAMSIEAVLVAHIGR